MGRSRAGPQTVHFSQAPGWFPPCLAVDHTPHSKDLKGGLNKYSLKGEWWDLPLTIWGLLWTFLAQRPQPVEMALGFAAKVHGIMGQDILLNVIRRIACVSPGEFIHEEFCFQTVYSSVRNLPHAEGPLQRWWNVVHGHTCVSHPCISLTLRLYNRPLPPWHPQTEILWLWRGFIPWEPAASLARRNAHLPPTGYQRAKAVAGALSSLQEDCSSGHGLAGVSARGLWIEHWSSTGAIFLQSLIAGRVAYKNFSIR